MSQRYRLRTGAIFERVQNDPVAKDVERSVQGEVPLPLSLHSQKLILNEQRPHIDAQAPADVVVHGPHVFLRDRAAGEHIHESLLDPAKRTGDYVENLTYVMRHTQPAAGARVAEQLRQRLAAQPRLAGHEAQIATRLSELKSTDRKEIGDGDTTHGSAQPRRTPLPVAVVGWASAFMLNVAAEMVPAFLAFCNITGIDPTILRLEMNRNPIGVIGAFAFSLTVTLALITLTCAAVKCVAHQVQQRQKLAVSAICAGMVVAIACALAEMRGQFTADGATAGSTVHAWTILIIAVAMTGSYFELAFARAYGRWNERRAARETELLEHRQRRQSGDRRVAEIAMTEKDLAATRAAAADNDRAIEQLTEQAVTVENELRQRIADEKLLAAQWPDTLAAKLARHELEYRCQAFLKQRSDLLKGESPVLASEVIVAAPKLSVADKVNGNGKPHSVSPSQYLA